MIMSYRVILKETSEYYLVFDDEKDYKEWEENGCCLSDLNSQNILDEKLDCEVIPTDSF